MHRRGFLTLLVLLSLGWPASRPRVLRRGRVFLVDGWILTAADLRALGLAA